MKDRGINGLIIDEYGADLVHMLWSLPYDKEIPTGSRLGNWFGSRRLLWLIARRVWQIMPAAKHREGLQVFTT